jgi:hypothetical protein
MIPTDRLPLSSDNAAAEAVGFLRLPTARCSPNNLPLELNRPIEREPREIEPLLWSTRLLTLTDPGGIGKSCSVLPLACEHLLLACAQFAERLPRAGSKLCILITN